VADCACSVDDELSVQFHVSVFVELFVFVGRCINIHIMNTTYIPIGSRGYCETCQLSMI
jgi:hypothetical protein